MRTSASCGIGPLHTQLVTAEPDFSLPAIEARL